MPQPHLHLFAWFDDIVEHAVPPLHKKRKARQRPSPFSAKLLGLLTRIPGGGYFCAGALTGALPVGEGTLTGVGVTMAG